MPEKTMEWMARERWEALVRGEDCPLCAACQSTEPVNRYGYTIADLRISRLRLARNQYVGGYCVLICTKHVRESYHLAVEEQMLFFQDLMQAAQAVDQVFRPDKMNLKILGNIVPHLHVHLIPRYYGDPAPGRPIDPNAQLKTLLAREYEERVQLIREAL